MIYLLSEMILALAVAVVLGMAVGWVIHRSTHTGQINQLRKGIVRKNSQLTQAHSEIAMLTDDYEELHRNSQEQIDALREQNKQIPSLNSNLEKSQLLVRQMMQRHEAQLREVTSENQRLSNKLSKFDHQEQVKNQLAAKLDERRRNNQVEPAKSASELEATSAAAIHDAPTQIVAKHAVSTRNTEPRVAEADAKETETDVTDQSLPEASDAGQTESSTGKAALFAAAESEEDPFDKVMEVEDDLQRELDQTAQEKAAAFADQTLPYAEVDERDEMDAVFDLSEIDDLTDTDLSLDGDSTLMLSDELPLDGSSDSARLFEPVDKHDDLQQIFGIGPLTEKALNELGITSYSQLAELKQHDIQRIADALEIGQGRIERDNWVGNARRQLEEVLEQL